MYVNNGASGRNIDFEEDGGTAMIRKLKNFMKSRKVLFLAVVFLICINVFFLIFHGYVNLRFKKNIVLDGLVDVSVSQNDNTYIISDSGDQIFRINPENKVDLALFGNNINMNFNSFTSALHVVADNSENIYVHDKIIRKNTNGAIEKEFVRVFYPNGIYKNICYSLEYEEPVARPQIRALQVINDHVHAIIVKDSEIVLRNLDDAEEISFSYYGAGSNVAEVWFNEQDNSILATLYEGKVAELFSNGNSRIIYDVNQNKDITPWGIATDKNGKVYIADISRELILYQGDNDEWMEQELNTIPYIFRVTSDDRIIAGGMDGIECIASNGSELINSWEIGGECVRKIVLLVVIASIDMLVTVVLLIWGLGIVINRSSTKFKAIFGMTMFSILLTVLICLMFKQLYEQVTKDDIVQKMVNSTMLLTASISGEDFEKLDGCSAYNSSAYKRIKETTELMILDEGERKGNLYAIMYSVDEAGKVWVRYALEENYGCNYPYLWTDGSDESAIYDSNLVTIFDELGSDGTGTYMIVLGPIRDSAGKVVGVIEVGCEYGEFTDKVNSALVKMFINIMALVVVALLIVLEIIEYASGKASIQDGIIPLKIYRILVFLVFFITNLTTPFLSIYALKLAEGKELMAALPISAEVFFGAMTSIIGNRVIRKYGDRKTGMLGALLFVTGMIVRFIRPNILCLTLGNAIQGAGWGFLLLLVNIKIASTKDAEDQEAGFTDYNVAAQNGINSGVVAGGFLLLFMKYEQILIFTSILSLLTLLLVIKYMKNGSNERMVEETTSVRAYIKFFKNKRVLRYFIYIVIPVVAASYFLQFLYPIMMDNAHVEESFIGYSYLINGLVTICFSNVLVRFVSKRFSKKVNLMLASLIYMVTFSIIGAFQNVPVLIIALVLLAVSDSFGYVMQETYYSELKETEEFGYGRAMGMYSLIENIAQAAGSFIFGLILQKGIGGGMIGFGIVIGICGIAFAIIKGRTN